MMIANRNDEKKVCCYLGSNAGDKIPKKDRIYMTSDEARKAGYTIDPSCNEIHIRYMAEKEEIDEIARRNGLTIMMNFDCLQIRSTLGEWRIIVAGRQKGLFLYHKNGPKAEDRDTKVPGYHWHNKRFDSLAGYVGEIARHDNWRMENEIIHPFREKENIYKYGSKAYKQHNRAEEKRRTSYSIRTTLLLLDSIQEQNRRAALA